jgi:hypothetical protein
MGKIKIDKQARKKPAMFPRHPKYLSAIKAQEVNRTSCAKIVYTTKASVTGTATLYAMILRMRFTKVPNLNLRRRLPFV